MTTNPTPLNLLTNDGRAEMFGELGAARGELVRIDSKAGMLLGLDGAGILFAASAVSAAHNTAQTVLLAYAAVTLTVSAAVILRAVRTTFGPVGIFLWARLTDAETTDALNRQALGDAGVRDLRVFSRLAVRKFKALRYAIDVMFGGMVLVAASVLAGAL